jgi:hypothetical protein
MRGPLGGPRQEDMDEEYAEVLLHAALKEYRRRSYSALTELIGHTDAREIQVPNGTPFRAEIRVLWASRAGGAVRVLGSIDDGRQGTSPLSVKFSKNPDGSIID